jgi:hypothetical protein
MLSKGRILQLCCIFPATFLNHAGVSAKGLEITVVNASNVGVVSVIVARKDNTEIAVGTTLPNGKLPPNDYKCDNDRNLVARPIDKNYFDSFPEPCSTPQTFLLMSRKTADGGFAFDNFTKAILFSDGSKGQLHLKPTISVNLRAVLADSNTNSVNENCEINYSVKVEKQVFRLNENIWKNTLTADQNVSDVVALDGILNDDPNVKIMSPFRFLVNSKCAESETKIVDLASQLENHVKDAIATNKIYPTALETGPAN